MKNMAYPRDIKGKAKEEMLNTTPAPEKRLGRNLNKWLEKKNYSLFEDWGETKFEAMDLRENHEDRSIPTIDLNKSGFFQHVYGINTSSWDQYIKSNRRRWNWSRGERFGCRS